MTRVTIEDDLARAVLPEGPSAVVPLGELVTALSPACRFNTGTLIQPDGVKALLPVAGGVVMVHETHPRIHRLRWIAADSPAAFGPGTRYREVRVALPYVVVLAVFRVDREGRPFLTSWNECYFRNAPLRSLDDALHFPALLNCSHFRATTGKPLAWICTQYLERDFDQEPDDNLRVHRSLAALLQHLFGSGFNRSSEFFELTSWFTETVRAGIDPRLASIEAWEQATLRDPLFALEVPWLPTGHSLRRVIERVAPQEGERRASVATTADLVRLIFHRAAAGAASVTAAAAETGSEP